MLWTDRTLNHRIKRSEVSKRFIASAPSSSVPVDLPLYFVSRSPIALGLAPLEESAASRLWSTSPPDRIPSGGSCGSLIWKRVEECDWGIVGAAWLGERTRPTLCHLSCFALPAHSNGSSRFEPSADAVRRNIPVSRLQLECPQLLQWTHPLLWRTHPRLARELRDVQRLDLEHLANKVVVVEAFPLCAESHARCIDVEIL